MPPVLCYGYAEDALSCAVMERLVDYHNEQASQGVELVFRTGFPENKRGFGQIKALLPRLCAMARNSGLVTLLLTDLDKATCAPAMIRDWFGSTGKRPAIPENLIFRVAEREVETWLLADREALSDFLRLPCANFSSDPDSLADPKQHLLNVIRAKGHRRFHKDMLPQGNAHVGPEYNPRLCAFVEKQWNIEAASKVSASLARAIAALNRIKLQSIEPRPAGGASGR